MNKRLIFIIQNFNFKLIFNFNKSQIINQLKNKSFKIILDNFNQKEIQILQKFLKNFSISITLQFHQIQTQTN